MNFLKVAFFLVLTISLFTTTQAQVKAFGQSGYAGQGIELKPGKYVYSQLQKRGLGVLGGLRVPRGCDVKMYKSQNLQGEPQRFSKNSPTINESSAYSLKVSCGSIGAQPGFAIAASDEVGRKGDLIYVDVNITEIGRAHV